MDVRLDQDAMNSLVAKAVFDGLTPERREELIRGAITALLAASKPTQYSSDRRSELQKAFDSAVYTAATKHAETALQDDPTFQTAMKKLFADVAAKLFEEGADRDGLVSSVASVIRSALTKDRY